MSDQWWNIIGLLFNVVSVGLAIFVFVASAKSEKKATEEQTYRESVRATLSDFAELRRAHADFKNLWDKAEGEEKDDLTRAYLTDIERFAVGLNLNAYDIGVLNKMSGGLLVRQWQRYFKPYIEKKRAQPEAGRFVSNATLYEYYGAAEPPVRCGVSHLSGQTEPLCE